MSDDFYTYELTYPESMGGTVFYVGKGKDDRIDDHEREARAGVASKKCDIIRQIWATGEQIVKHKVSENMTNSAAFLLEERLIKAYGYANLANRSFHGNQNAVGKRKSQEKQLVQVGVSVSGTLRDQIEACMVSDGIEYSREACYEYVKKICYQALREHIVECKI